jgi:SAM-dependent methyltransferase
MPVFLDKPDREIGNPRIDIYGWVASETAAPVIRVAANGRRVRHILHDRPDVRRTLPGLGFVAGVYAPLSVFDLDPCDRVDITLSCGADATGMACVLSPAMQQARAADATLRLAARDKCSSILVCPICRSPAIRAQAAVCGSCGAAFSQTTRAINMIADHPDQALQTDNIALPPDADAARALIARVTRDGGWVLDCGGGRRSARMRHVVTVGTTDHAWVDLLARAEALPFADGSFDAVIAMALLDQARDPAARARDALRVVKPGGEVLAAVPALRPADWTPRDGPDITAQGLAGLFAGGGELIEAFLPTGGPPFRLVQALLREYLAVLPDGARDALATLTVGEVAMADPDASPERPGSVPAGLPDACLTMVRVRRL